jgi:hypothetical protein
MSAVITTSTACKASWSIAVVLAAVLTHALPAAAASPRAPQLPEIRISRQHGVPSCVTPERLMAYLTQRNSHLEPHLRTIARAYKMHGEALGIRWDYAFFQMLLETNYLTFRRGNGEWGDVKPHQNNFAGLGATGGGVPGDSFPDVSTGVLAQLQHLLAYSGQHVATPLAPRTREKQGDIIEASLALHRPVRFSDLTLRWASDRNYARSITMIAEGFYEMFCGRENEPLPVAADAARSVPQTPAQTPMQTPVQTPMQTPMALTVHGSPDVLRTATPPLTSARVACDVWQASYGGGIALLIRSMEGSKINYTVLQVDAALERPQADAFIRTYARGGETIARFPTQSDALTRAFGLCPGPS